MGRRNNKFKKAEEGGLFCLFYNERKAGPGPRFGTLNRKDFFKMKDEAERKKAMLQNYERIAEDDVRRLEFIMELDKMKTIYRQSLLLDRSRTETDAEHSWQLAMMAIVLREHAPEGTDLLKTVKMCLVHDIVEIDAGDTFAYDKEGNLDKAEREQKAADRIYAMLPGEEGRELRELWEEFDRCESKEALYANALDRLQPMMIHAYTDGANWLKHEVELDDVLKRAEPIRLGLPKIWPFLSNMLYTAKELGLLK